MHDKLFFNAQIRVFLNPNLNDIREKGIQESLVTIACEIQKIS